MPIPTPQPEPSEVETDRWTDPRRPWIEIKYPVPMAIPIRDLICPRPTVRILFYTDDFSVEFDNASEFGVSRLRDLILAHNPFYATFQIDLLNRHAGGHAANKLTSALLGTYDQVWFFGIRQANTTSASQNELTTAEVGALNTWMTTGGVLITGDHANPRPPGAATTLNSLVNLGRAIGHRVPRAGELRRWEGPPGADHVTNHNTQVPVGATFIESLVLQEDAVPQALILKRYALPTVFSPWLYRSQPHSLFCGRDREITVFPDHMHEGQIEIPLTFPTSRWPSSGGVQPLPEVVAWGTDKRDGNVYPVVAAYDGQLAGVGRIVSDSTWHHYFNVNLVGFGPGPIRDDIADYFVNLAVWLTPAPKREQMKCWLWWWVVLQPTVQMAKYQPLRLLGAAARDVLGRVATQCQITEFTDFFDLDPKILAKVPWPPEEFLLGGIVREYHDAIDFMEANPKSRRQLDPQQLRRRGLVGGVEDSVADLEEGVAGLRQLAGELRGERKGKAK
jgi:hypothetical protein